MKSLLILFSVLLLTNISPSQPAQPSGKTGQSVDMLTPQYYLSSEGAPFRIEVDRFLSFARKLQFHHPLEDPSGQRPHYSTPAFGQFGAGKGPTGTAQHHPATDLRIGNSETEVTLYAAHDGLVSTRRDSPKYRHYLFVTKNVEDSSGTVIGKIVTIYAHLDLDLDSTDDLYLDGKQVNRGDIVSRHLYSGTRGGPHLHFEIRYYRPEDVGDEDFYGFSGPAGNATFTQPSTGSWPYGYWNPDIGYGYAHPEHHVQISGGGISQKE